MPESQNTEWKSSWRDEWLEWICGYANAQGGKLYVGINDDGKTVGVKNSKKLLEDIPNKVSSMLGINVDVNLLTDNAMEYIEIVVPSYQVAISYKGTFFYRSGSTNQRLQGSSLTKFILEKQGVSWDSLPIPNVSVDELDSTIIRSFKENAVRKKRMSTQALEESDATLIEKLGLIEDGELTNAAVLLFHPEPQRFFPGAYTRIGYFEEGFGLRYEDAVRGSLLEQAEKVPELLMTKYLKNWVYYDGMVRDERYAFPPDAIREIVYNALIHARHAARIPIQIKVYEDELYFSNSGGLPATWTTDMLFEKHRSEPPNPDIAHAFYLAGYIESWGQGVTKICDACLAEGIDLPTFTAHADDMMVMLKTTEAKAKGLDGKISSTNGGRNGGRNGGKEKVDATEVVIGIIKSNPSVTQKEISEISDLTRRQVERAIMKLKKSGVLSREGSTKSGYWALANNEKK